MSDREVEEAGKPRAQTVPAPSTIPPVDEILAFGRVRYGPLAFSRAAYTRVEVFPKKDVHNIPRSEYLSLDRRDKTVRPAPVR